jgi:hypothetical protein
VSEQSGGPGWWLASDGRWYPPELAAPPAPVSYPPPAGAAWTPSAQPSPVPPSGPPPTPTGGRGVAVGIVVGGILTLVVLALLVAGFVSRGDDDDGTDLQTAPPTTEGSTDDSTDETDDDPSTTVAGSDVELPPGFELVQGDGVSVGLPEGWTHLSADELDLPLDEMAEIFPDLEPEVIDSFSTMLEQGAVLIAVDGRSPTGFGANINVLEIPGESDLDEIQSAAPGQLESLGGVVTETTPLGESRLRARSTTSRQTGRRTSSR